MYSNGTPFRAPFFCIRCKVCDWARGSSCKINHSSCHSSEISCFLWGGKKYYIYVNFDGCPSRGHAPKVGQGFAKGWFLNDQPFASNRAQAFLYGHLDAKGWRLKNQPLAKKPPTFCIHPWENYNPRSSTSGLWSEGFQNLPTPAFRLAG